MRAIQPYNTTVHYNNWGYALAGAIVEKISGESWDTYVKKQVLSPLHMDDTDATKTSDCDNFAKPYTVLDDHSFKLLPSVDIQGGNVMDSSQGIRSTVNDMLK